MKARRPLLPIQPDVELMTFGILANIDKPGVQQVTTHVISYLRGKQQEVVVHEELGTWYNLQKGVSRIDVSSMRNSESLARSLDILIALGGDGTMLKAARIAGYCGVPILGVNLGKLGFLAEISVEEMNECLDDILAHRYDIEHRLTLDAKVKSESKTFFALNDIVIDRGSSPRVIELETFVNNEYLMTYSADGIIVTTPTGSTAYSLASGGPIVVPESPVLTINPIAPHSLTARPVIVPENSVIRIVVHAENMKVHLTADGQEEGFYDPSVEFSIQKSTHPIKLVKRKNRSYFNLLRTKLLWGRDVRVKDGDH